MSIVIYHNPRCSKSRKTLELIREGGVEPEIVEYLQEVPDAAQLKELAGLLDVPLADLLRKSEAEFVEAPDLPALSDDDALANWLRQHPIVLQRPIVVDRSTGRAVVGRPPENVSELLDQ